MDFAAIGIEGVSALLAARRASAAEVVEECLAGIAGQAGLNAFVAVAADAARARARALDALPLSRRAALHGVPFAVKDVIATRDLPTSNGSRVSAGARSSDAAVITRLEEAGAVLVGKLNLWEFALSGPSPQGEVLNPWSAAHSPGGSSSGSGAAVAAGLVPFALGTDTGGSIRVPAAFCGVSGLRPTYGRVPTQGVTVNAWTIDTVGPLAARAADVARVFAVVAEGAAREAVEAPPSLRGIRVGLPRAYFFDDMHPDVATAMERAVADVEARGAEAVDVDIPHAADAAVIRTLHLAEAAQYHERRLRDQGALFGAALQARLEEARLYAATDYIKALRVRAILQAEVRAVFERCDVFLVPTDVNPPSPVRPAEGRGVASRQNAGNTFIASMAGIPALAIPAGFTRSAPRLPLSLMVHAPAFEEPLLFRFAAAFQEATRWHLERPPGGSAA